MKNIILFILIIHLVSCASIGYNNKKRSINNTFSIKVINVEGATLAFSEGSSINNQILNKNQKVDITLDKLNKKNRTISITHPEYESKYIKIKKTPRVGILILDVISSPFLAGLPILVDPFKSDFYKIGKKNKDISISLNISKEGLDKKIEKCISDLDINSYNQLVNDYPDMISQYRVKNDISIILDRKIKKCIEESNINSYNQIISQYKNFIDSSRISKDLATIKLNIQNNSVSDKVSNFIKQNCKNVLFIDFNKSNMTSIFNNGNEINNSTINYVEDRFSANSKALDISNCPLIKLAVNYSNYYGTYGIGFWYRPIANNQKNLTIKSNSFDISIGNNFIDVITGEKIITTELSSTISLNKWHYIYIEFRNDINVKYNPICHLSTFVDGKIYTIDLNYSCSFPNFIQINGNTILDEFAIYLEPRSVESINWIKDMNEIKIDAFLEEKRLEKEAEDKREREKLAKIQRLKDQGIDWIVENCWSKVTKDGENGSVFNSVKEFYCFQEDGKCDYYTGMYMYTPSVNFNVPLYSQNHLAKFVKDNKPNTNYQWKLNDQKNELIIIYLGNEIKKLKVDQKTQKISWD